MPVGPDQDRDGHDRLLGLPVSALHIAPEQQVELLVGPPQLDVRAHRDRVVGLQQRIHHLQHRNRLRGGHPLGEIVALEQLGDGGGADQPQQVGHRHVQPLTVASDLQPLARPVEDLQRLGLEGGGIGLDLLCAEHWPQRRAPGGIADPRRVVADDQHDHVPGVLELAQLAQHDRVTEVDVRRGRVDPELYAQRTTFFAGPLDPLGQRAGGQAVDGVCAQRSRHVEPVPGPVGTVPGRSVPRI